LAFDGSGQLTHGEIPTTTHWIDDLLALEPVWTWWRGETVPTAPAN